jgi:hypothetical protein
VVARRAVEQDEVLVRQLRKTDDVAA